MLHNQTKVELEDKLNCCGLLDTNATHAEFELDFSTCTAVSSTHQPLCSHSTTLVNKGPLFLQTRIF